MRSRHTEQLAVVQTEIQRPVHTLGNGGYESEGDLREIEVMYTYCTAGYWLVQAVSCVAV